jgi:hypothetical protein
LATKNVIVNGPLSFPVEAEARNTDGRERLSTFDLLTDIDHLKKELLKGVYMYSA